MQLARCCRPKYSATTLPEDILANVVAEYLCLAVHVRAERIFIADEHDHQVDPGDTQAKQAGTGNRCVSKPRFDPAATRGNTATRATAGIVEIGIEPTTEAEAAVRTGASRDEQGQKGKCRGVSY